MRSTLHFVPTPLAMAWQGPGQPHQVIAVPHVQLEAGDALVEIEYATICGSDIHTASGHRSATAPLVLGHEQVGRVVATTDEAVLSDGTPLVVGDRVIWGVIVSCGQCSLCLRGLSQKCEALRKYGHEKLGRGWQLNGGFATHAHILSGTAITKVSEQIPAPILAPVSCATATAAAALRTSLELTPMAGKTVVVSGAGMVGLAIIAMAVAQGAVVVALDPHAGRRKLAVKFGALIALDPITEQLAPALSQAGLEAPLISFEASGAPGAVKSSISMLGIGGVAVLVGSVSPSPEVGIDPEAVVRKLLKIVGVHNYLTRDLEAATSFMENSWNTLPFADLVGPSFPLSKLDEAIEVAKSGADVRVGIHPDPA